MKDWMDREMDGSERFAWAAVDDALRSEPQESAPPDLLHGVMQQVRAAQPLPRFRLAWIDYALSFLMVWMFAVIAFLSGALPPYLQDYLGLKLRYWLLSLEFQPLQPVLFLGFSALALGAVFLAGWLVVRLTLWKSR